MVAASPSLTRARRLAQEERLAQLFAAIDKAGCSCHEYDCGCYQRSVEAIQEALASYRKAGTLRRRIRYE